MSSGLWCSVLVERSLSACPFGPLGRISIPACRSACMPNCSPPERWRSNTNPRFVQPHYALSRPLTLLQVLVSQLWNAIIISMYREHLLSIDHVQRLLYHQVEGPNGTRTLRAPPFFTHNNGNNSKSNFFPVNGEAERRISFFASSLTTALPEPLPVDAMPTFTVLVPHYSEKILLSLREIIREEDQNTRLTQLEYLKQLHPVEWDNFVKDTKILAEESG